ncbi:ADP-ribosyl-[dinitrogen reductase] glycohydrolase [Yersinia frederiksenii]|nr:ADP-ribosyl-[dinitrogen reductase] glycohydrolase [Yersinia frederiksenii]
MKQDLLINRAKGALLGLAVGDALGTTLEFQSRPDEPVIKGMMGGGPFGLRAGEWTDDTSMMLCLADSLIDCNRSDPTDQIRRYIAWRDDGYQSCTGTCFDIGSTVAQALDIFEETGSALAGSTSEYSAGNGSLMRVAPVALFTHNHPIRIAMSLATESCLTTHGEQRCIDACRYMTFLIHTLLAAQTQPLKADLLSPDNSELSPYLSEMHADTLQVIQGSYRTKKRDDISSSGFVIHSLEAALWCFWHSDDFAEGALLAANLGDDADTVAAIYGQLAGAYYGYDAIPKDWCNTLAWRSVIESRALLLINRPSQQAIREFIDECMPNPEYSFAMTSDIFYKLIVVFDWQEWSRVFARQRYIQNRHNIASAPLADCLCLITMIVRSDRFCDGIIRQCASDGTIGALLNRLEHFADKEPS